MKVSSPNICVVTLGCSKNAVDSERLLSQIKGNSYRVTTSPEKSDVLIINTCGFIEDAKQESINTILGGAELKKNGTIKKLLVMGCLSERYKVELESDIPEVDKFFGVMDFGSNLLSSILTEINAEYKHNLVGERVLSSPSHYAYLKISEGCNNPCSFCAIPLMRGGHKSRPMSELLNEAALLRKKGVKEINLIAQDLTYYGVDTSSERTLSLLLEELATMPDAFERIRLLYAYPTKFPEDILPVMKAHANICNYLDMPIQHASTEVLKSMRRGITKGKLTDLIHKIRDEVPNIRLRTTLIIGYPTETEAAFQELYDFVAEMKFDRLGCFMYSQEENTTAYELGDPIHSEEKQRRLNEIMSLQESISKQKNEVLIGTQMKVMVDRIENGVIVGRTEYDAPEVDNEFYITDAPSTEVLKKIRVGEICNALVTDAEAFDLFGEYVATL